MHRLSYGQRALKYWPSLDTPESSPRQLGTAFLNLMETKKSNLCVAVDVCSSKELLMLADDIGPEICLLKTHCDIVDDWSPEVEKQLVSLAAKHNFMIFEDRKFADIGQTVQYQYERGLFSIASWSHITNAHPIPGDGIVQALGEIAMKPPQTYVDECKTLKFPRGLLLLAEMSSKGSLAVGSYTDETVNMAYRHAEKVIGFVASRRLSVPENIEEVDFITMSPGIQLQVGGDNLGQQYRTPDMAVSQGTDVVIVGRGIIKAKDPASEAKLYRKVCWEAYLNRLQQ